MFTFWAISNLKWVHLILFQYGITVSEDLYHFFHSYNLTMVYM